MRASRLCTLFGEQILGEDRDGSHFGLKRIARGTIRENQNRDLRDHTPGDPPRDAFKKCKKSSGSYWLIFPILLAAICFEVSLHPLVEEKKELLIKYKLLEEKIAIEEKEIERREEILMNQSDLAWQELAMIRVLGVIPEGTQKVIFQKK